MTLVSMTGFAAQGGQSGRIAWTWEARSVNGRGLDVRVRLPDGLDGLEPLVRKAAQARLARGTVNINLRISTGAGDEALVLDTGLVEAFLSRVQDVETIAAAKGVEMSRMSALDILAQRGVLDGAISQEDIATLSDRISADLGPLLDALAQARREEGVALGEVVQGQLDTIDGLIAAADQTLGARAARAGETLKEKLAALLAGVDGTVDEGRLAQELAMLAVKADVTEEIDRLRAHVTSARDLVTAEGPVGRKLDFLMQEFNREANTLCSKSQDQALTTVGLDLKVVIDQMREQIQNVE